MTQPAPPVKIRVRIQSALRRSLSKLRHGGPPPAVPPKDNGRSPQKVPSYYTYKHSQADRDGRHYRQQSYGYSSHAGATAAAAGALPSPPTSPTMAVTSSGAPYLKLPTQDDQPLMPRQELLDISSKPVGTAQSAPVNDEKAVASSSSLQDPNHVYGQPHCIASVFDLDKQLEQHQIGEQKRQLDAASQQPEQRRGQEHDTRHHDQVVSQQATEAPAGQISQRDSFASFTAAPGEGNNYAFPDKTPADTTDATVTHAAPVVHERVQRPVHEVIHKEVHRDVHHYEELYRIQPVLDLKVLPTRHIFIDAEGNASELHFEGGKPPPGFEFGKPL
ncbi:hypothetical protein MN608_09261 [Microdochium nivale]|nr:hypothetical protein MN608_09261 [Microdochium nivale]